MYKVYEPSINSKIIEELSSLCDILIDDIGIIRLPNLADTIKNNTLKIIYDLNAETLNSIKLQLDFQQNYIWTDNVIFKEFLNTSKKNSVEIMRDLLSKYYYSIIEILADIIPKCMIYYMVEKFLNIMSNDLYKIIKEESLSVLLKEFDNIAEERNNLINSNKDLNEALLSIKTLINYKQI